MDSAERRTVAAALDVAAELTATVLSKQAKAALLDDLAAYDAAAVEQALQRCRRELDGPLTLAAILARIDTGLPDADEAFALLLEGWRNEALTVVLPEIALQASGQGAWELYSVGDVAGARQAFARAYTRLAAAGGGHRWTASVGSDRGQCTRALLEAVAQGRLSREQALSYLPGEAEEARHFLQTGQSLSAAEKQHGQAHIRRLMALLQHKMLDGEAE